MLSKSLLKELQCFLEEHEIDGYPMFDLVNYISNKCAEPMIEIEDWLDQQKEEKTFSELILAFIDQKGYKKDSDFYKKAGLDRRHFSKIRSSKDYKPKKETAFALILALELNEEQAKQCLSAAGLCFNFNSNQDLIVLFCIKKGIYGLKEVNYALDYFSQKPLMVLE